MRKILFVLGLFVAAGLAYYCLSGHSAEMQNDINTRLTASYDGVDTPEGFAFDVSGRDVVLTGLAANKADKARLGEVAAVLDGVRVVDNRMSYHGEEVPVAAIEEEPEIQVAETDDMAAQLNDIEAAAGAREPDSAVEQPVLAEACQKELAQIVERETINFDSGRARIKKESYATLNRIVEQAKKCERAYIYVHGHTDSTGDADSNKQLSLARARAVGVYLMKNDVRQGIKAFGHGEVKPVADNGTVTGRAQNRRIEFQVEELKN